MPPAGSDPGGTAGSGGAGAGAAVEPFRLPYLGTTWLDRGSGYRLRRGLLVLVALLFVAVVGGAGVALYLGFASLFPPRARVLLHVLEGAAAAVSLVAGWVRQRPVNRVPVTPEQVADRRRAAGRRAARGYGSQGLAVLCSPVLPALAAYLLGAVLSAAFVRVTPRELGARQDYERRLAAADHEAAGRARRAKERRAPRNGPSWR